MVSYSEADVILPVFLHNVTTKGIKATISVYIAEEADLGTYNISVRNAIGSDYLTIEVVPVGKYSATCSLRPLKELTKK